MYDFYVLCISLNNFKYKKIPVCLDLAVIHLYLKILECTLFHGDGLFFGVVIKIKYFCVTQ
jgi:hypothetical protein